MESRFCYRPVTVTSYGNWLKEQGVDESHIININFEDRRNKRLRDPDELLAYIDSKLTDDTLHHD